MVGEKRQIKSTVLFVCEYFRMGWMRLVEYRVSSVSQILGMIINDTLWLVFWMFYFKRFPVLNGWMLDDVVVLWCSITMSFGLVAFLFSNIMNLTQIVYTGQLDYYLSMPRNVLLHVAISRFDPLALGDVIFSLTAFALFVDHTPTKVGIFLATTLVATCIFFGFVLTRQSSVFFLGNSETVAGQAEMFLIHFGTYPLQIFDRYTRIILVTIVPSALLGTFPAELVRSFNWGQFAHMVGAAVFFVALGITMFYKGLRRYESGNLIMMRG